MLKIELMTASCDHHVFIRITTFRRREGSVCAHGKGYLQSHRLMIPASSASGTFSGNSIFMIESAFFSPMGLVFGRMGEFVKDVLSRCSDRKLHKQLTRAV